MKDTTVNNDLEISGSTSPSYLSTNRFPCTITESLNTKLLFSSFEIKTMEDVFRAQQSLSNALYTAAISGCSDCFPSSRRYQRPSMTNIVADARLCRRWSDKYVQTSNPVITSSYATGRRMRLLFSGIRGVIRGHLFIATFTISSQFLCGLCLSYLFIS